MNTNSHLPSLGFPHVALVFQSPAPFSRDTFNTCDMFSLFHGLHLRTDMFTLTILMNSSINLYVCQSLLRLIHKFMSLDAYPTNPFVIKDLPF